MGRAGRGDGGSSHSSHSSGHRLSSGHHPSLNRTSSINNSRSYGSSRVSSPSPPPRHSPPPSRHYSPPSPPPPPRYNQGRYYRTGRRVYYSEPDIVVNNSGSGRRNNIGSFIAVLIVLFIVVIIIKGCMNSGLSHKNDYIPQQSTSYENKKIKLTGGVYITDCIKDELGWFDNEKNAEKQLETFFDKTGIQPYIILHEFDESLKTDQEKVNWAEEYYDKNFKEENIFLFVYFAEKDVDNDVGYMAQVSGEDAETIMDEDSVEIFWDLIDQYWYEDISTDDVFKNVFNKTAQKVMK